MLFRANVCYNYIMAQYKVPQDVEADDKLLGPFTFRQFVYLMITAGLIGLAFALFNVFPLLAIIPIPVALFFAILALPLKKDQPMETYLTAMVSYHLKPKTRVWNPGQRESTIIITAPKQVELPRTRNISGEEASTRLSFLANVVDTEGYSIRGDVGGPMRDDFLAENLDAHDMLDGYSSPIINQMIVKEQQTRRSSAVSAMQAPQGLQATTTAQAYATPTLPANYQQPAQAQPTAQPAATQSASPKTSATFAIPSQSTPQRAQLAQLANNSTATVDYLAKKANEITKNNEVYVSLH